MIRQMESNRGHGDDPKVGIFWYNVAWKELFGVVSHPVRDYSQANASEARSLILDEFDLPADRTSFEYTVHWDIGQKWM